MKLWKFSAVVRPSQTNPCDGLPQSLILVEQTKPNVTAEHCAQCIDFSKLTINMRNGRSANEFVKRLMLSNVLSNVASFLFGNIMKKIWNETPPMKVCTVYNVVIALDAVRYVPSANISMVVAALPHPMR